MSDSTMGVLTLSPAAMGRLDQLLGEPAGRRVGVLGLGVAGRAMALYLRRRGARVIGADRRLDVDADALREADVELRLGPGHADVFAEVEGLAISPGVDPRQQVVQDVLERGVPVFGELELVGALPAKVAAITGTNGKSTTTALLGHLVAASGRSVFVGGNFGEPIASWLNRDGQAEVAVLELSSFQLETAYRFAADVAVMLNVSADHMDRYDSFSAYLAAKRRLLEGLEPHAVAVLNHDDPHVRQMSEQIQGRLRWFSTEPTFAAASAPCDAAWLADDVLCAQGGLASLSGFPLTHPSLLGRHNRENAMGALLAAEALGLAHDCARHVLEQAYQDFRGLEHRLEILGEVGGVLFVNDSKATNDDSAATAMRAMARPVVLLAGGRDKHGGYAKLLDASAGKLRALMAYGEARDGLARAFEQTHAVQVCASMRGAFDAAWSQAQPGDVVLLAPACSSFDEFANYLERGRSFKHWVRELMMEGV